ncbi:MAG TPA: hypothetical protein VM577_10200 [Anaerovoracaceae bacterium]|nr:hypothetical protein [Anaerovoracaceae bacterium]
MINSLMAVKIGARTKHAPEVQEILLQLSGKENEIKNMLDELNALHEVSAKLIEF